MRTKLATLALAATLTVSGQPVAAEKAGHLWARDINGVTLGMTANEVRALFPNGTKRDNSAPNAFEATRDGVDYQLVFTKLGRLWSIRTSQPSGNFQSDGDFRKAIKDKLAAKYGPIETYTDLHSHITESIDVEFNNHSANGLEIWIQDVTLANHDDANADAKPKAAAEAAVKF